MKAAALALFAAASLSAASYDIADILTAVYTNPSAFCGTARISS